MSASRPNTVSKSRPRPIAPEGLPGHITVASSPSGWGICYPNMPFSPLQATSPRPWFGYYSAESVGDSFTVQCQDEGHDRQKAKEACPRRLALPTRAGISPAGIPPSTGNTSPKVGSSRRWNLSAGCSAPQVEPLCRLLRLAGGRIFVHLQTERIDYGRGTFADGRQFGTPEGHTLRCSPIQGVEPLSGGKNQPPPENANNLSAERYASRWREIIPPAGESRNTCGRKSEYLRAKVGIPAGEGRHTCGGRSTSVEGRLEGHLQGMRQPGK